MSEGVLVGGEPQAILAASVALHEVAFRMDNVGARLALALGSAATTVAASAPLVPLQALAVGRAIDHVALAPAAGLGQVAGAYEAASIQLRLAGQALEIAGLAELAGSGTLAALRGERVTVLERADGVDRFRESMTVTATGGPSGGGATVTVRHVDDGRASFYVVELTTAEKTVHGLGAQVNGYGGYVEGSTGDERTLRWAVATRDEARLLAGWLAGPMAPLLGRSPSRSLLPPPTEVTTGAVTAATLVNSALGGLVGGAGAVAVRREVTVLAPGGERLTLSLSGGGQAGVAAVAGTGGAATLRIGVERDAGGAVTRLTVATTTVADRGRHGLAPLEELNREATLEERAWELDVTPELRGHAEGVAAAVAAGREPATADVLAITEAVAGVEAPVRTYDVRHQQVSVDVAIPEVVGVGGSLSMDTAHLREPPGEPEATHPPARPARATGSPGP